jgi:hypothetical protein
MRLHRPFTALLGLIALAACEKNAVRDITAPMPAARILFFNFAVGAPGVHLYADDAKVTATAFSACSAAKNPPETSNDTLCLEQGRQSTLGVNYGGVAAGGRYSGLDAGARTIQARLASDQATVVSSVQANVQQGKHYSYYQSGFYSATTKSAESFLVEDDLSPTINWSVATVRFVNAMSNAEPMTLYATNAETGEEHAIGGTVAYASASPFTQLAEGSYDLSTRYANGTSNVIVRSGIGFDVGRTYTITARGDITVTSTTAANRPFLDFSVNR